MTHRTDDWMSRINSTPKPYKMMERKSEVSKPWICLPVLLFRTLTFAASYALTISEVTQNNKNPVLVGKWLSGGPQPQGVVSARWADPDWIDVTLRIRAEGIQFANDLNTFSLPGFATVDLYVAGELRGLMNNVKAFVAVTNLFDNREKPDRYQYWRPAHRMGRFENSLLRTPGLNALRRT
jgi:TonB dependent receptor